MLLRHAYKYQLQCDCKCCCNTITNVNFHVASTRHTIADVASKSLVCLHGVYSCTDVLTEAKVLFAPVGHTFTENRKDIAVELEHEMVPVAQLRVSNLCRQRPAVRPSGGHRNLCPICLRRHLIVPPRPWCVQGGEGRRRCHCAAEKEREGG